MAARKALVLIDGQLKQRPDSDTLEKGVQSSSITTPLDTNHAIMDFAEQLISTHKESGFGPPNKKTYLEFIDKPTGLITRQVLTDIALDTPAGNAIAFGPDGTLWYRTGDPVQLYRIDPVDGTTTLIGGTTPGTVDDFGTRAMDFHPDGTLYGMQFDLVSVSTIFGSHLVTIDLDTGDVTDLDFIGAEGTGADAFAIKKDPTDPAAFVIVQVDQVGQPPLLIPPELQSLDLSTRALVSIGTVTGYDKFSGMVFDSFGVLYATARLISSGNKELITINTSTGAPTSIGETKFEEQRPAQSGHSLPGLTIRPRSAGPSEFSFSQHNALALAHEYGVVNAYKVTLHPPPKNLLDGMEFNFTTTIANTGAVTLDFNDKGAEAVVLRDGTALTTGDILANVRYRLHRDQPNTRWYLLNPGS